MVRKDTFKIQDLREVPLECAAEIVIGLEEVKGLLNGLSLRILKL